MPAGSGPYGYGPLPAGSLWALALTMALGALAMLAEGFVINFPMMFLSGAYCPTSSAAPFLTPVIKAM